MWIKGFTKLVEQCSQQHALRDTKLVIDAQNFFYDCYQDFGLNSDFGAECDKYAERLKSYLNMFKQANLKCYFIFKGGTRKLNEKIDRDLRNFKYSKKPESNKYNPVFAVEIHLQVLQEMGFEYAFSEFESKPDCKALAKKLGTENEGPVPVLSQDVEFMFSGVPYIPKRSLKFDKNRNIIQCELISRDVFLEKHNVCLDKLAIFILLTDANIFPENSFAWFFKNKIRITNYKLRNNELLRFLSTSSSSVEALMFEVAKTSRIALHRIEDEFSKIQELLKCDINGGLAIEFVFRKEFDVAKWFEWGVASNNIAKSYIDLYRSDVLFIQIEENEILMRLTLPIIVYAYDLLTDFKTEGLKFIHLHFCSGTNYQELVPRSVTKPSYHADQSVFENGWGDILRNLGLFQHFLTQAIGFNFNALERVPGDVKILMMALVYFSRNKCNGSTTARVCLTAYSVLLCHVVLNVVLENDENNIDISTQDRLSAKRVMADYFEDHKADQRKSLSYPLIEFTYCLRELNNLNKLCGSPFEPTVYRKSFNGIFVYNIIYGMQDEDSVKNILQDFPSVSAHFNYLIDIYDNMVKC